MSEPQTDDLYPNQGDYFQATEPVEQKEARQSEKAKVIQGRELLEDIIKRLDERIAFYDSVNSIAVDISVDPETFQRVAFANKLTRDNLTSEREWLIGLLDDYVKK